MGAHATFGRMLAATAPDRILDGRTASEIIEGMIPEAEKQARARRLFAPIVAARDAAERAKHERRWAAEEQEQSNDSTR